MKYYLPDMGRSNAAIAWVQFREGALPVRRSRWFYVHCFFGSAKSDPRTPRGQVKTKRIFASEVIKHVRLRRIARTRSLSALARIRYEDEARHEHLQPAAPVQFRLGAVLQHSNTPSLRATGFEDKDEAPGERRLF